MSKLQTIKTINEIPINKEWVNKKDFKSKNSIVDEYGFKYTPYLISLCSGRQFYQITNKQVKNFSLSERCKRIILGSLAIFFSFGLATRSKPLMKYISKKHHSICYAIPFTPINLQNQGPAPQVDINKKEKSVQELDISNLTEKNFNEFFENNKLLLLQELPIEKIELLSKFFTEVHWKCLSRKQILEELDLSKIDQGIFNILFNGTDPERRVYIKDLSATKLNLVIKFFSDTHALILKSEQIIHDLDYKNLPKDIFNKIFIPIRYSLLNYLTVDKIAKIAKFFTQRHWNSLSNEKISSLLDILGADKITKNIFDAFFNLSCATRKAIIQSLPMEKIYILSKFFTSMHWGYLSDKQITVELDFTKITQDNFVTLFKCNTMRSQLFLFPLIADEKLIAVKNYFTPELESLLSSRQLVLIKT